MVATKPIQRVRFFIFILIAGIAFLPFQNVFGEDNNQSQKIYENASTPIQTTISIDSLPKVEEPANLRCEITSILDAPGTKVQIELPPDAEIVEGEISWEGDLYSGEVLELSATIRFYTEGNKAIFCRALRVVDADNVWGDLAELYLSVGGLETQKHFQSIPASERDVLGEPEDPEGETAIETVPAFPAPDLKKKRYHNPLQ